MKDFGSNSPACCNVIVKVSYVQQHKLITLRLVLVIKFREWRSLQACFNSILLVLTKIGDN